MATINTTDPKPGFVYDLDTDTWYPLAGIAAQSLDGLTDVIITSPATNQSLIYDGTNWVNSTEVGDVTAVTSGTGITVTNGTGPIPSIAINTAVTADLSTAQTLTNKTVNLTSNTLSGTIAQFNTALSDADFATLAGTETLTNKTLTDPKINLTFDPQTSSTYITVLNDNGQVVTMDNASANTLSIPTNASVAYPVGTQINILQIGAGQTTIQAVTSATTTILSTGATAAAPKLRARYSMATCIKAATDLWYVVGDIA
jgi:hypothetical protein